MGERNTTGKKLSQWLMKYKYALLVLLLGIVLLLWPSGKTEEDAAPPATQAEQTGTTDLAQLEASLSRVLAQVDGAGQVQVMLTLKTGMQYLYQTDQTQETQETADGLRSSTTSQTVIVSNGSSQERAVVSRTIYPTFQGALVVSSGADQPRVKLDLVNAVSSLTGLSADKITVIKMKAQ